MADKREVIKASGAILISNTPTLLQRRTWNLLLANAYDELASEEEHAVTVKDLSGALRFDSKNIDYLKESARALVNTVVEWNVTGKDGEEWGVSGLLASVKIINGVMYYAYSPALRQRLHNPAMYARISLSLQNTFDSKHALAIYELCVDAFDFKAQQSKMRFFGLDEFRALLGLNEGEYILFKDLNKHVLKKSVAEINKKSDLKITTVFKRKGRKVIAIKFDVKKSKSIAEIEKKIGPHPIQQAALPLPEFTIDNQDLYQELTFQFAIKADKAVEIMQNMDEFYIKDVLKSVRKSIEAGKVKNVPAFTIAALEKDFREKKSPIEIEQEKKKEARRQENEAKRMSAMAIEKAKEEKVKADQERRIKALTFMKTLPQEEQDKLTKLAKKEIEGAADTPYFKMMLEVKLGQIISERYEV